MCTARPSWKSITAVVTGSPMEYKKRLTKIDVGMSEIVLLDTKAKFVRGEYFFLLTVSSCICSKYYYKS